MADDVPVDTAEAARLLSEAEEYLRGIAGRDGWWTATEVTAEAVAVLLVEYDRRGAALDAARADVERLRGRTHEIQAQEMAKRAALDSEVAEWRNRHEAAKEWTDKEALSGGGPPWWFRSYAEKSAIARLVAERDEARAETERLRADVVDLLARATIAEVDLSISQREVERLRAQRAAVIRAIRRALEVE